MARPPKQLGTADEVEAAYYDALAHADIDALMALWAEDEEIVCVHPGAPRLVGHAAIRAAWEAIFARGALHVRPVQVHVAHNLMCSVHSVIEDVRQQSAEGGEVHILATNVYLKTPRGWRMMLHHAGIAHGRMPEATATAPVLH